MQRITLAGWAVLAAVTTVCGCFHSRSDDTDSDTASDTTADSASDTGTTSDSDTESDSCSAMDARGDGTACNVFVGVSWDGRLCRSIYCGCEGGDCDTLYASHEACVADRAGCMAPCPYSDWPAQLTRAEDGCLCGGEQYFHCCPDGMDFCVCKEGDATHETHLLCGEKEPMDS